MCILTISSKDCLILQLIFFFKQKTTYDMRISEWSSDVCSSDLAAAQAVRAAAALGARGRSRISADRGAAPDRLSGRAALWVVHRRERDRRGVLRRSEEHTSELQSLMRISYAVFCLKKKKKQTIT